MLTKNMGVLREIHRKTKLIPGNIGLIYLKITQYILKLVAINSKIRIAGFGRMNWQRARDCGKRNYSELCIQRYKRILGNTLHDARELSRQKTEAMIGCGILNKMTGIGMPISFKIN